MSILNQYSRYVDLVEILELPDGDDSEIPDIKARLAAVLNALGVAPAPGTFDHSDLDELLDDDHLQYILGDRAQYAALLANVPAVPVGADGLLTGGDVVWTGLLNFLVSAATYRLLGVDYSSVQTALTLSAADATNPRIDVIAVDDTGIAVVIAGTPSATPAIPSVDPETQIALSFILVNALATVPANVTNTNIYLENTEWTSSQVGTHHTLASTSNPFAGTKDIEATAAVANDDVLLVKPAAGTTDLTGFNNLIFYLRFKAVWPNAKSLVVSWLNGSTQIGNAVTVKGGLFNLDAANITTYQQVVIPISAFNALTVVTTLRLRVTGGGAAIGYYLDNISIQAGLVPAPTIPSNIMINRGAYNSAIAYAVNDVVTSSGGMYIALAGSTNVTPGTNAAIWKLLGGAFDTTNPAALGTAAPGTLTIAAHRDHVHSNTVDKLIMTIGADVAVNRATLAGTLTLTTSSKRYQSLDPDGSARNVDLPAEAEGLAFFIANRGNGAEVITVRNDAAGTVDTIDNDEGLSCICDGTAWISAKATLVIV